MAERCACGHDLHEPGRCGDKRLTFDCGCSYSPDTQPAPRKAGAILTREEYRQRLQDAQLVGSEYDRCSDGAQENLLAHDAALRAEAKSIHDERDRLWLELLSEKARADAAEASRDRLAEALREIAMSIPTCGVKANCFHHSCKAVRIADAALKREERKP